jgi:phosphoglycerate dehydrogenase-like enzyme
VTGARRPVAAFAMAPDAAAAMLTGAARAAFAESCDVAPGPALDDFTTPAAVAVLRNTELLITGWGCPPLDAAALAAAPRLRAVVHTAGSIRGHMTQACWDRGIKVSSAAAANARPVAEYTVAMILVTGKQVLEQARGYRAARSRPDEVGGFAGFSGPDLGNYRRTVGVLSASLVGRRVIELLRPYDLRILLHDPYVSAAEAHQLGAEPVELAELFAHSDVVSVHTPLLPATRGLVDRDLIFSMRPGAVLLNTARGAVLDQQALTDAATAGRVRAVLDVTDPEVLPAGHPLWTCDNVLITPHIAGSQGNELARLTDFAATEAARWAAGTGFAHPVLPERLDLLA